MGTSHARWGQWLPVIEKFAPDNAAPSAEWRGVAFEVTSKEFTFPNDVSSAKTGHVTEIATGMSHPAEFRLLWQASVLFSAGPPEGALFGLSGASNDCECFAHRVKGSGFRKQG